MAKKNDDGFQVEGFEKAHTVPATDNAESGEWITPDEGTLLEGKIERAFLFDNERDPKGKPRVAYAIRCYEDSEGNAPLYLISERASYADAMRKRCIGDEIKLLFSKKVDLLNAKGQPNGNTMWETEFLYKNAKPRGESVVKLLMAEYEARANALPF